MINKLRIADIITLMFSTYLHYIVILDVVVLAAEFPKPGFREYMILLGAMVISYFLREKFSRAIGILIVHVLMIVGICFMPLNLPCKIVFGIELGIEVLFAAKYIFSGYSLNKDLDIPFHSFVLLAFSSGYAVYLKNMVLLKETLIIGIAIYFLYILSIYLNNLEDYVISSKDASGIPLDKMIPINSIIVFGIFTIMVLTVILADKLGMGDALWEFLKASLRVLFVIIKLISAFLSIIAGFFKVGKSGMENAKQDMMIIQETIEDPSLLDAIVYFLLKVIIIIIAAIIVLRIFRFLYRYLITKRLRAGGDSITKIRKPDMSKTKQEKIKKEVREGRFTPEQKARRIYKKRVESVKKKYIPERNHTTADITELFNQADSQLRPDKASDISELTEMYEAVRYGNVHPDPQYLKKMQSK